MHTMITQVRTTVIQVLKLIQLSSVTVPRTPFGRVRTGRTVDPTEIVTIIRSG